MPKDQEQKRRSPLDGIQSVGMAALAGVAGAAIFYRKGGSDLLSGGIKKATKVISEISEDLSNKALKDVDANAIKNLYGKAKTTWNAIDDDVKNVINIRQDRSGDLFNILKRTLEMENNKGMYISKMYDAEKIIEPLAKSFGEKFAGTNDIMQKRLNNFISDTINNPGDAFFYDTLEILRHNDNFLKKHFKDSEIGIDDQKTMLNAIHEAMEKKKDLFKDYKFEKETVVDQMIGVYSDVDEIAKVTGIKDSESAGEKMLNKVLGDSKVTVKQLIDAVDSGQVSLKNSTMRIDGEDGSFSKDFVDILKERVKQNQKFEDLYIGGSIRVDEKGTMRSFKEANSFMLKALDDFSNTLPGKLAKTRDIYQRMTAPTDKFFTKGDAVPLLANLEKNGKTKIDDSYSFILGKTYKINGTNLEHVAEADNMYLQSGKHGTTARTLKMMAGDGDRGRTPSSKILRDLDIGTSPNPTKWAELASYGKKFKDENWARNIFNDLIHPNKENLRNKLNEFDEDFINEQYEKLMHLNNFFKSTTKTVDKSSATKLKNATNSTHAKRMFELLEKEDDELLEEVMKLSPNAISNNGLSRIKKNYGKNSTKVVEQLNIHSDKAALLSETRAVKFRENLRKEVAKEGFLAHNSSERRNYNSIVSLFEDSGLKGEKLRESKYLAYSAIFESKEVTRLGDNKAIKSIVEKKDAVAQAYSIFSSASNELNLDDSFISDFRNSMTKMVKEKAPLTQKGFQRMDEEILQGNNYGDWTLMRKSVSPLDMIRNINDKTTRDGFFKQFTAGRKNMENVTTATMFPYFAVSRLVDPLSILGLGFSAKNTGSVKDLTAAVATKRVLPIMAGLYGLSYLNDMSRDITGTSLAGAAANSVAAIDIGKRKIVDSLGLTEVMRDHRALNPLSQYHNSDETEYRNAEEQKEWYRNGVTPVRKGRWWSFGSFSEYRGGKIDYYQPNYLRRVHSNYSDVSIYGSSSEKWAHSWIPTPTHPLAPVRRLLDPYWLERKHYWDRPYPVSGKMFEEGTPWGGILNPTIGEILKPQKKMHQEELGRDLIDVRDLIAERNAKIRDKATGNKDLIQIGGLQGGVTPVSYTAIGHPTVSDVVLDGRANTNGLSAVAPGINYANEVPDIQNYYESESRSIDYSATNTSGSKQSFASRVQVGSDSGNAFAGIVNKFIPRAIDNVAQMNTATMSKSRLPKQGVVTADSIFKVKAKDAGNLLHHEEALADLRNITSTTDALKDIGYSTKELSGMYGFIFDEIIPQSRQKKLANASRINSYSRMFWDSSIGGKGGEFMEIARRFFPHEDHNIEQINPIRNTMPEWMPTKFQHGDPFASIPKGEMRLPGAGYETINELHSDQFGKYGAFDRMKILADIAPWSREYKVWRDIASKTVDKPELEVEMKAIRKRVIKQSQTHEFYPYKFLGQKLESTNAVISDVDANGFTIIGSDERYNFAGIKLRSGVDIKQYVQPGMNVRLKYDANKHHRFNANGNISAIVMIDGENLNKQLLEQDSAIVKEGTNAADYQARFSSAQIDRGKIFEAISHAPISFVHDKFSRIDTPLESYKNEQIYGSSYSTWSHPIKGFVNPMLNRAWSAGPLFQAGTVGLWALSHHANNANWNIAGRKAIEAARAFTNPASFIGATAGYITKMQGGKLLKLGMNVGTAAGLAGYAITRIDKPLDSTLNFGVIGSMIGKQLWNASGKGALVGAAVGFGLSAIKNPDFNKDRLTGPWIPKDRKKQWEVEEYYDRLKYIKYTGLYEKAASKALKKEGVDVRRILNKAEFDEKKKEKTKRSLLESEKKIRNSYAEGDSRATVLLDEIQDKLTALTTPTKILRAGKYTKAALAYKQAAESTIYGLKEDSAIAEILRAVPKNDRDYILEFSKENDPKKQKEILKYMSPYKRRVLEVAWGKEPSKLDSNTKFFATHKLPGTFWSGWQPDVNLDNVQIKTIENEGMLLSDFGFYDSQADSAEVRSAPSVDMHDGTGGIELRKNLITALNGVGLTGVDVSIEPSEEPGIQMIANIARINSYNIKQSLNNSLGRIFY